MQGTPATVSWWGQYPVRFRRHCFALASEPLALTVFQSLECGGKQCDTDGPFIGKHSTDTCLLHSDWLKIFVLTTICIQRNFLIKRERHTSLWAQRRKFRGQLGTMSIKYRHNHILDSFVPSSFTFKGICHSGGWGLGVRPSSLGRLFLGTTL